MNRVLRDSLRSDYSVLLQCPFLPRTRVVSVIREEFGSKAVKREDLQRIIEEQWTEILKDKPFLFNQSKFRYFHSSLEGTTCRMELGLTNYKSYVGSNLGSKWNVFYDEGRKLGDVNAFFANPLGNQCAVVLRDGNHVLLNRSYKVAEGQGLLTCIGGHPEPSSINIKDYEDATSVASDTVTGELFYSMQREVFEESNIPLPNLSDMFMIGVMACNQTHGREVQLFCCFSNLTKEDVIKDYEKGPVDQYESLGINFLSFEEIIDLMNTHPERIVPETRALYSILVNQYSSFTKVRDAFLSCCPVLSDPSAFEYCILNTVPFLDQEDVYCDLDEAYQSKAVCREDLKSIIEEEWNQIRKDKPFLFNQSKFRYFKAIYDDNQFPRFRIQLGLTDYKSYVGSNLGSRWKIFYDEGTAIGDENAFFSNPLGNISGVVLKDGFHVLMKRSYHVAEAQGRLTCVGGHPEPSSIGIQDYSCVSSHLIRDELFDSMKREIFEEMNIPVTAVMKVKCIGVIASNLTHGRQVQLFCCFVNLSKDEVLKAYQQGPIDQYESRGLEFYSLEQIADIINTCPDSMSCEARGLYSALVSLYDTYIEELKVFEF